MLYQINDFSRIFLMPENSGTKPMSCILILRACQIVWAEKSFKVNSAYQIKYK